MAILHFSQEDFNKIPVLNFVVYSGTTEPTSPVLGELWEDTNLTPPVLKSHNGTGWVKTDGSDIPDGTITNAKVSASAAIAKSKLDFGSGLTNSDIATGAAIARTKLDFGSGLVNADIATGAAIAKSKIDFGTGLVNADISASAAIVRSKLNFGSGLVNTDIASSAAIARSKLDFGTGLVNADISASAAIATSKISGFDTQVRTSRLDQMAAPTSAVSMNGQRITSVATPSASTDAVNKQYVDDARAGIAGVKDPVRSATETNVASRSGAQSVGGVSLVAEDRVLLAGQTTASQNGIYVVKSGAWVLADDANAAGEIQDGTLVAVSEGTYAGNQFIQTATPSGAPGSWNQTWTVFTTGGGTYVAGAGLTESPSGTFNVAAADGSITVNSDSITVGNVPLSKGGTGATSASGARTALDITAYQKHAEDLGALSAGSPTTVTHNLGTKDVSVVVRKTSDDSRVEIEWAAPTTNTVTVTPAVAVADGDLRIVVFG